MKIAIVKLSALGDIIHTSFILQFIKSSIPESEIDWIVEKGFAQILDHHPDIDTVHTVNLKAIKSNPLHLISEIKQIRQYAMKQYDLVIDLQGLMKSAIVSTLLGKKVVGFDERSIREKIATLFYSDSYTIPYDLNTIDRYRLLVAKALNISLEKKDVEAKKVALFYQESDTEFIKPYLSKTLPNVIFIIGANWPSRIYPKEKLITIANSLDANILIPFGNEEEKENALFIAANVPHAQILPKIDLNKLKALISQSNLVIGNDTGPTYIAWANNIPSITLFGPTPPTRIYSSKIHVLLKSTSSVNPFKLDKEDYSIQEISETKIIEIAQDLLGHYART
ncbi:MAG: lipopolysaccharide heptosyltransferase I [Epsilonproteobacteria bacterium]|nr:lipopolysaccharide heptosyltransferase I [Campylobacterota bacterium]